MSRKILYLEDVVGPPRTRRAGVVYDEAAHVAAELCDGKEPTGVDIHKNPGDLNKSVMASALDALGVQYADDATKPEMSKLLSARLDLLRRRFLSLRER